MGNWEKELIELSKYAGMREDLVQAGGGNSSVKMNEREMAVKSSGVQLADIRAGFGYSVVDYRKITEEMDKLEYKAEMPDESALLKEALISGGHPSIETFLHAITNRVTLHTHSAAVSVLAARLGGMEILRQLFPFALAVDYATPGLRLAKCCYHTCRGEAKEKRRLIFLKNHGVLISGETVEEVIRLTEEVNEKIESAVGLDNTPYRQGYELYKMLENAGVNQNKVIVKAENKTVLDTFCGNGNAMWDFQISPDCVVFCGKAPFVCSSPFKAESLSRFIEMYGEPVLIIYNGNLFIRADSVRKAREIESVLSLSARVTTANQSYGQSLLSPEEQDYLLGWDVEKFRQKV